MAVRIKFDNSHNVIHPTFVLATRKGKKLGVIPTHCVEVTDNFNSFFDLAFEVHKFDNGKQCLLWDKITDFKLVWCREWDVWFEIYINTSEENGVVKYVEARSLGEAELSQINLYDIEINTVDDIAQDDYIPTVLFNEKEPKGSLLNRILEKAPHYKIKHVDLSIANIQKTFSFDGKSIYDALQEIAEEIGCLLVIECSSNSDGTIARTISMYDLESYCLECGTRDSFQHKCSKCGSENILTGYGEDTNIFISTENLADDISFKTDVDSVKNCFKLEAGDDLMTATILNCNPNGSGYIWFISDELKSDMSDELVEKLESYDELYNYYVNDYSADFSSYAQILSQYNKLIEKYKVYDENLKTMPESIVGYSNLMNEYYNSIDFYLLLNNNLMPSPELSDTTAAKQASKLTSANLSPVSVQDVEKCSTSTASSAVLAVAKVLVDSRYQVKVKNGVLDGTTWTGNFTITNYSDEEDTAVSSEIQVAIDDDIENYTKQRINKALSNATDDANDIISLFSLELDEFSSEIKKYCLTSLVTFHDSCQTCLDILIEQGIANNETWANKNPNLYETLYVPYYNKLSALQTEISVREDEITIIAGLYDKDGDLERKGIQNLIEDKKNQIQDSLNFEKYLGTELWLEFVAYRREDTYSNDNYISDGLDNAALFNLALEFIEVAKKEIYKSATLQHSIEAKLKNLLVIKEFKPLVEYFSVGNWIHVRVDGEIFRLRLLSYQINFNNLDNISITFSDVKHFSNYISDAESIADQVTSISGSYDSVKHQASQGNKSKQQLDNWVTKGLALTKMKIIDDADNQNITWDNHGLLCREYLPVMDSYDDKQLKIINRGLYLTDDNWLTSKAGIGDFTFYNPETGQMEEAYGVIADTLVGNLILSEEVGVYNMNNSVVIDDNGITITTDNDNTDSEGAATNVFTIQKKVTDADGNETIEQIMYVDDAGELVLNGTLRINSSSNENITTLNDLCDDTRFNETIAATVASESESIRNDVSEQYNIIMNDVDYQLEQYKAEVGQYMQFDENGLTLGSTASEFKTVIDNRGLYFKQGGTIVSYVNNNQLYIPNAVIENALVLGQFFFCPREDGGCSLTWQGEIEIDEIEVTAITSHPTNQTIVLGEYAVFNVTATGTGITYQWQYKMPSDAEWTKSTSSSAKTDSFTYTPKSMDENGVTVRCVVTDADGDQVYSKEATLYITESDSPIIITSQPQDQTVTVGETATFKIVAQGDGLTYQWQYKAPGNSSFTNSTKASATTTAYQITPSNTSVNGEKVRCVITDENENELISDEVTLYVTESETGDDSAIVITKQPQNLTISKSETAVFTVEADGTDLTYQWQYSFDNGSSWTNFTDSGTMTVGSTTNTLTRSGFIVKINNQAHRCIITDTYGNQVISDTALLTVTA